MKSIVIPIVLSVLGTLIQLWLITYKKYAKENKIKKNNFSAMLSFAKEEFGNIIFSFLCTLAGFLMIFYTADKKIYMVVSAWGQDINIFIVYFLIGFFGSYIVDVLNSNFIKEKIKKIFG